MTAHGNNNYYIPPINQSYSNASTANTTANNDITPVNRPSQNGYLMYKDDGRYKSKIINGTLNSENPHRTHYGGNHKFSQRDNVYQQLTRYGGSNYTTQSRYDYLNTSVPNISSSGNNYLQRGESAHYGGGNHQTFTTAVEGVNYGGRGTELYSYRNVGGPSIQSASARINTSIEGSRYYGGYVRK
eukprot:CAMPEP_0114578874 /NCGR_PEP_ID=MMETSP0125-20121206/3357_1 /TAXON_ID=485358 ORGANISM="Aristerostoma sp., Strain ATCC 50986" /NCGR_SAMPLE_ID=MMETSP0125 /ASSEMBLY_ACC=CAM_ASM_000245 /LENGTH=185 /DNA_ID=CAMNT_0001769267 /DNA_START=263 /DNA_END=820 /DNA_ORIENTATION=+